MAYLEWQENLDTGISVIDGQHKRIVVYINQLYDASHAEIKDVLLVKNTMIELIDYTISHFAFEESLLEDVGYLELLEHKKSHNKFTDKIFNYRDRLLNDEDIAEELLKLLHDWLFSHILHDDKQYVPIVKQHFLK